MNVRKATTMNSLPHGVLNEMQTSIAPIDVLTGEGGLPEASALEKEVQATGYPLSNVQS